MQDQMRFEDENGDWIKFNDKFPSNHFGTSKKHGEWAFPVYPKSTSIVGSIPTPYIWDDRADFREIADQIEKAYRTKIETPERYAEISKAAREWVTSDESMMSARLMCENVIDSIEETFEKWKPRFEYEFIKVEKLGRKAMVHPLVY
jgi:hypothetical protein